jgi:hypothetical protein
LEYAAGTTFRDAVETWLSSKGIPELDDKELNIQLYKVLEYREEIIAKLKSLSSQINFIDEVDRYLFPLFQKILNPICTEVALSGYRKELTRWVDKVEKGKALFVEAPMGFRWPFLSSLRLLLNLEMNRNRPENEWLTG